MTAKDPAHGQVSKPAPTSWLGLVLSGALIISLGLGACTPVGLPNASGINAEGVQVGALPPAKNLADTSGQPTVPPTPRPFPQRPRYEPGELVDYTAQTGDTLVGLAHRFNTTVEEILAANTFIPAGATTMPPGMPMKIPIYYLPLWGSPYQILPDSYFVNGPAQIGFDTEAFVAAHPGWLKDYRAYVADANRSGAQIVDYVAHYYSLSPRLLLTLLEYQSGALSQPAQPGWSIGQGAGSGNAHPKDSAIETPVKPEVLATARSRAGDTFGGPEYALGYVSHSRKSLFLQLAWAANQLNDAYYSYRTAAYDQLEHKDGRLERIDPWQNAATAALMRFFNTLKSPDAYSLAISPDGYAAVYRDLFGDPWANPQPHIPGSLEQPSFSLPFQPGDAWAMTGGPHTAWGTGEPLAALDFAPPSKTSGCVFSDRWATAVASGVVVRSEVGQVMLDLDGDGDERTGWSVFYMHVATDGRPPLGTKLETGDPIGRPSCEGGSATGTHIHIARKYNGEWIPAAGFAGGILAFNLEGWVAYNGTLPYLGTLRRHSQVVTACTCSNAASWVQTDRRPPTPTPNP